MSERRGGILAMVLISQSLRHPPQKDFIFRIQAKISSVRVTEKLVTQSTEHWYYVPLTSQANVPTETNQGAAATWKEIPSPASGRVDKPGRCGLERQL